MQSTLFNQVCLQGSVLFTLEFLLCGAVGGVREINEGGVTDKRIDTWSEVPIEGRLETEEKEGDQIRSQ